MKDRNKICLKKWQTFFLNMIKLNNFICMYRLSAYNLFSFLLAEIQIAEVSPFRS